MDDIAACIKDHQYNEAIRHTVVDPEESLAKAILEEIPTPPKGTPGLVPEEEFASKVTFEEVAGCTLGRYFLCECMLEEQNSPYKEQSLEDFQAAMDQLDQYVNVGNPSKMEAKKVLKKFVALNEKENVFGLVEAITKTEQKIESMNFESGNNDELKMVFSPLREHVNEKLFKKAFEAFKAHEKYPIKFRNTRWYRDKPVCGDDFVIFRDLGRGAFGVVSGARHRVTGQMVALKGMNRKLIKGKKVLKMVKVEFKVLKTLGEKPSPFCVSLRYSFMDPNDLFFGLPLCTGGDLMFHLRSNRYGYGVERSRFFAAQILLALEHMHNLGILYRDLKPENVLIDDKGHTKISDMGLAILTGYTPRTIGDKLMQGKAGTPGYWPPEMIEKKGYGFDADWWSYGVQLYEFLSGICAFSETHTKCKDRNEATLTWEIQFPDKSGSEGDDFPEEAKDLILQLLDRDRSTRLGAKPDAVDRIKAHPFFAPIDWDKMLAGEISPPWTPPNDSINAASQEELQERSKEHEYKKLKLTEEDNIEGIAFSSRFHELDLVTVLKLEKKGKLNHLKKTSGSAACSIL